MRSAGLLTLAAVLAMSMALQVQVPKPALAGTVPGTGCQAFPADNVWNTDVSSLPVHPRSADWLASTGANSGRNLHPDFGGPPYGIPFNVVHSNHQATYFTFDYWDESDPAVTSPQPQGPYPYGNDLAREAPTDSHLLTVDQDTCKLYETWATDDNGPNTAGSGAIFDLGSDHLRPAGWTSADAAGQDRALRPRPDRRFHRPRHQVHRAAERPQLSVARAPPGRLRQQPRLAADGRALPAQLVL